MTVTVKVAGSYNYSSLTSSGPTEDVYPTADEFDVDGALLYVGAPDSTVAVYAEGSWSSAVVS